MKIIIINSPKYGTHEVFIDNEDFEKVNIFKWHIFSSKNRNTFYATRQDNNKTIYLHRFIVGEINPKILLDHKDHNGLNCQKENIRITTGSQNMMNRRKNKNTTSIYKGVSLNKRMLTSGKISLSWMSAICINNKSKIIGRFKDEIEAAKAYDKNAKELFGEFANLNFPT